MNTTQVSKLSKICFLPDAQLFKAGNIAKYYSLWESLTHDNFILNIVREGLKIDFFDMPKRHNPHQSHMSLSECNAVDKEIQMLLSKHVIVECNHKPGEFISPIFTRPKKDGSLRMILNLKKLNSHVNYNHFKMESLENVLNIIQPYTWMASVDLKDAFYTVPVHPSHQKYLRFKWNNTLYQYLAMPNGYSEAMRIFTKLLKVPFSFLRQKGHSSVVFVDDTYLQGSTFDQCLYNVQETIALLQNLGFTIHSQKSILTPTQKIEFLGFVLDSTTMTVTLSDDKKAKLLNKLYSFKVCPHRKIRDLASTIGSMISCFPAVPGGPFHYRSLERFKINQLKLSKGNFEALIPPLPREVYEEIIWWEQNIMSSKRDIIIPQVDCSITTDASNLGWGATDGKMPAGGRWDISEKHHINYLELKAVHFAIQSYCKYGTYKHIRINCDNTTAIAYINKKRWY